MRTGKSSWSMAAVIGAGLLLLASGSASSQQIVPTPDPARDCQTVRTCNFSRTGQVRGCLSSYTCRTCRMVRTRCDLGGGTRFCEQVVCSWGGGGNRVFRAAS